MSQIFIGSITLSVIHALIPSHWLPLVTIGKAQGWDRARLVRTTALAGLAHTTSTTTIGLLVSFAGLQFTENQSLISTWIIPGILLAWGMWFISQHYRYQSHNHINKEKLGGKTYPQLLVSIVIMMFLSPCLEINTYFLSAGTHGWPVVVRVAFIYNVVTLAGMLTMVILADRSLKRMKAYWMQNEQLITGITLVCLAILNYFIGL